MQNDDYNDIILKKIGKSFDIMISIGSVISFIMAVIILVDDTSNMFVLYDSVLGFTLLMVCLFRKHMDVQVKILITLFSVFALGIVSIIYGAFSGIGLIVISIVNTVAVAFLSRKKSLMISGVSVVSLVIIWQLARHNIIIYEDYHLRQFGSTFEWAIQMSTFILFLSIIHIAVGAIKNYLIENIIELEKSMEKTYNLAYYDQLTGLPNRHMFSEELFKRSSVHNVEGFLVLFDLKKFKLINSIHGNELGDEVLIKVATIFSELKGDREMVARISGNEYAWWMEALTYKALVYRLEYLKALFYDRLRKLGITKKIEFYVSYAHFPTDASTIDSVYQKATLALEYAKKIKTGSMVAYAKELEAETRDEEAVKERLIYAIKEKAFDLAYQEKVDSVSGEIVGLEALARWHSDTDGTVSPAIFVPIIEKGNLSVAFGNLIVEKALDDYKKLETLYGKDIKLSINISPSHMISKGFKVFVMEAISIRALKPENFVLEITEEVMIETMDTVTDIIKPLREFGIKISLDDFGTGYSSLNYLAKLELDELKIDKSFVDQLEQGGRIEALIATIMTLTSAYNISTVAEGVETIEQCEQLKALGCHIIQGYYFSKPTLLKNIQKKEGIL